MINLEEDPELLVQQNNSSMINDGEDIQLPVKQLINKSKINILKNEVSVNEQKFKLTATALNLFEILSDYMHMYDYFPTISFDTITKLFNIIKVYYFNF